MAQHAKARCGKTGKPFLHSWKCPGCDPQSFPALRWQTSSGAPCRSRRQLPPTRRSPSRASQRLTKCQRVCCRHFVLGIKRIDQGRHRTCGADSSISSASCTTLTACQLCLSTPCSWTQAYRHNCLAGCIVNFMRTSGTPCRNRRHHTPAPRHAPRCLTM